ncbi:MAG: FHA domain-containing protein [Clostridiales bacterium]|nr:FHA domain-containing protein [Clostridiales bacterium]
MKTEYKRDLQNNYLILEVAEDRADRGYGLQMAKQNQVKGLLPMHESRKDGKLYLYYEITSKQTLESLYEKKTMDYPEILFILSEIRDTMENMRKYLLSPQQLLFAPELIYVLPEHGGLLFCYYAEENEYPITLLAEFILKRLEHKDRMAVALGYGFYQQATDVNFSLSETLKEILGASVEKNTEKGESADNRAGISRKEGTSAGMRYANGRKSIMPDMDGEFEARAYGRKANAGEAYSGRVAAGMSYTGEMYTGETYAGKRIPDGAYAGKKIPDETYVGSAVRGAVGSEIREAPGNWSEEMDPPVIHRERKKHLPEKQGISERLFSRIHPAVLLTFLLLSLALEVPLVFDLLSYTEAGGCFFLLLSAEILLNHRLLNKKTEDMGKWQEEEESEEYQKILEEVYQDERKREAEPVEETCCLVPDKDEGKLRLVYRLGESGMDNPPEICLGESPIYIGKIKDEANVILQASTVSRMHARLTVRDERCYLKDMNSKNGTFVNGRRLMPQEECEIKEEDVVAFAQIEYQVVRHRRR